MSAVLSATRPLVESSQLGKRRPERTHVRGLHLRISTSAVLSARTYAVSHFRISTSAVLSARTYAVSHLRISLSAVLSGERSSRAEAASDIE